MGSGKGGGGSPKQRVAEYYMSLHTGVCSSVEAITGIWYGERRIWRGRATENRTIGIDNAGLFGGPKKEGGVRGYVDLMCGRDGQQITGGLAQRLGAAPENLPAFRGIASLFFRGTDGPAGDVNAAGPSGGSGALGNVIRWSLAGAGGVQRGFMFGANNPYLRPIWVTARRTPWLPVRPGESQLANSIARLDDDAGISMYLTLDDSGSMNASRLAAMKASVNATIDLLITRVENGARVDLGWAGMNRGRRETRRCSVADLQGFKSLTNAVFADGFTPFDTSAQWVRDWFVASDADPEIVGMAHIMLSDGEATGNSAATAASIWAPLLSRQIDVDMWGVAMDNNVTASLSQVQNMPGGVPIVNTGNVEGFIEQLEQTLPLARDANLISVIAECLVNRDWGMGAPEDVIDWDSVWDARDQVRDEGLGVFVQWQAPESIEAFIDAQLNLAKAALFTHPRTGKLTIRLLRDEGSLPWGSPEVNPDNATLSNFSRRGWGEIPNEAVATWTNPENEKEETVTVQNLASIARQGAVISTAFGAQGLRSRRVALAVANRELAQEGAPLISCEAVCDRRFWDVVPYDRVTLRWPEYGIDGIVMRVMKVGYGDSKTSAVTLTLIEDIYSRAAARFTDVQENAGDRSPRTPVPVVDPRIIEVPAFFASRAGVDVGGAVFPETGATVLATEPNSAASSFDLLGEQVQANGEVEWRGLGSGQAFVGAGLLQAGLPRAVTSPGVRLTDSNMGLATNRVLLIGGLDLSEDELELALVSSVQSDGTATLTRGVLDTTPREWPEGTLVWVASVDDWAPIPSVLTDGQTVRLKLLTQSVGGQLDIDLAPVEEKVVTSRVTRPLRPANLRVNDELFPSPEDNLDWPVTITWSARNRLLEDTVMLPWDASALPEEDGVTYDMTITGLDEEGDPVGPEIQVADASPGYELSAVPFAAPEYAGIKTVQVRVTAVKDELANWQDARLLFKALRIEPPGDLTGVYEWVVLPPNGLRGVYMQGQDILPPNGLRATYRPSGYGNDYGTY